MPSTSAYTVWMVSTGPLPAGVWHPVALPSLPSRMGLATPAAGAIVTGAEDEVPEEATAQFPT